MTNDLEGSYAATDTPYAGKVALSFFFSLMDKWGCSAAEQKVLLGSVGNTTYHKFKSLPEVNLSHDLMERISYLMGIHKSLRVIFSNQVENAYDWISKPNQATPFNGQSALQFMLSGRMAELSDVRRYLDREVRELSNPTVG
ncbi:MbcA/ParS/Xre antitoxin family protein [Pseudomonas sp. EA_35y_Pfl2_R5]|uniref:MbcA/ParS/Xre antitoxin family protein n=1 Tax=Pseudomonas sp. EA_35y_Pfl2_R5 TaxID=3088690 RepID=UPI0030DCAED6